MALTVTPNLTTISDCDSTSGWSGGIADTVAQIQGSGCLAEQCKTTTSPVYSYTLGTTIDISGGEHIYQWMQVAGTPDTKANGGFRIYLEDSSGNNSTWYVGGSDTAQGWTCFVLDPSSTRDSGSGTLNLASIKKVGVQFKTLTSVVGKANNIFWDVVRYGTGLQITSASTDDITIGDIYGIDNNSSNKYGVVTKISGVYFLRGKLNYGDASSGDIVANLDGEMIAFTDDNVSSSLYEISLDGSSGSTSTLSINGSVIKSSNKKSLYDFSDADGEIAIEGTTITNAGYVKLNNNTNSYAKNSVFDSCNAVYPYGAVFTGCTITNTTESTYGSVYLDSTTTLDNMNSLKFSNYSGKYAVYISSSITGTIDFDNFNFDGSGTDVYWEGTSGTLTINLVNGTNASTYSSGGGTVEFVSSPVTTTIKVVDATSKANIQNARVYLVAGAGGPLTEGTVIFNTLTDSNGEVSDTRALSSDQPVSGWVRKGSTSPYYKTSGITGTISSTNGLSLTVQMIKDE